MRVENPHSSMGLSGETLSPLLVSAPVLRAPGGALLHDTHGRPFRYLRLSITDQCNFRCTYCLPEGATVGSDEAGALSVDAIGRLALAFRSMGFEKVRITGGEPSLRKDLPQIIELLATEFPLVALSTNGWTLERDAQLWRSRGLAAINISLDSLRDETFKAMTGAARASRVEAGIHAALAAGLRVKVNCVVLRGQNDKEMPELVAWAQRLPLTLRFIELMETGVERLFFLEKRTSFSMMKDDLSARGWSPQNRDKLAGPAVEWAHEEHLGRVGFIEPYGKDFCGSCNRLRVTAAGALKLCLFGDKDVPLLDVLEERSTPDQIVARVRSAILNKTEAHGLAEGRYGTTGSLSSCGG